VPRLHHFSQLGTDLASRIDGRGFPIERIRQQRTTAMSGTTLRFNTGLTLAAIVLMLVVPAVRADDDDYDEYRYRRPAYGYGYPPPVYIEQAPVYVAPPPPVYYAPPPPPVYVAPPAPPGLSIGLPPFYLNLPLGGGWGGGHHHHHHRHGW
jgi:hypothetical protein